MNNPRYAQQGDTILTEVEGIPIGAKHLIGESILHYGNTGNHHKLTGGAFGIYELDGKRFLDVVEETRYSHEEHNAFFIAPAKYALTFVQERDPFSGLVRPVVD